MNLSGTASVVKHYIKQLSVSVRATNRKASRSLQSVSLDYRAGIVFTPRVRAVVVYVIHR